MDISCIFFYLLLFDNVCLCTLFIYWKFLIHCYKWYYNVFCLCSREARRWRGGIWGGCGDIKGVKFINVCICCCFYVYITENLLKIGGTVGVGRDTLKGTTRIAFLKYTKFKPTHMARKDTCAHLSNTCHLILSLFF